MSRARRAWGLWLALALPAALSMGGCGFTPLYGDPVVVSGLSHVDVTVPKGRVGYLLHVDLDNDLGRDLGDKPTYRLEMVLGQTREAHGLQADATAQRYELDLQVTYTLIDLATGKVATTGEVMSFLSYDSADQPYAGIAAGQDTENRLASDAAQKIQMQLAAWMSHQPRR